MGREGEVVSELLRDFQREEPGVPLRVEQLPWSAAHEKLLTAFAGDATPDLAQMGNTWLPEFVALGALQPLDVLAQSAPGVDRADYFQGIWDTNVVGGKLYGLPWYVDTRVLFYRRDLLLQAGFNAPPTSWGEWKQMLLAIKRLVGPRRPDPKSIHSRSQSVRFVIRFGLSDSCESGGDRGQAGFALNR